MEKVYQYLKVKKDRLLVTKEYKIIKKIDKSAVFKKACF